MSDSFANYVRKEVCIIIHKELSERFDRLEKRLARQDWILYTILITIISAFIAHIFKV